MAELLTRERPSIDPFRDQEQPIPYKEGVPKELIDICSEMVSKEVSCRPFIHHVLSKDVFQDLLVKYEAMIPDD